MTAGPGGVPGVPATMRAVVYERFGGPLAVRDVPVPDVPDDAALVRVEATGLCRSDWHGWRGHDPDVTLPQVPGHEFAGTVAAVGARVRGESVGTRVTAPFVCGCGRCPECARGEHQVCRAQTQPGFTHDGSFAEYVVVRHADVNLVALPDDLSAVTAAALGCRYATAWRAVTLVGRVAAGEWVVVHGCGGVGLSAVQIAVAAGARVLAVDVAAGALSLAARLGAETVLDAAAEPDVAAGVRDRTDGGAQLSLDALGSPATCAASIGGLARRGRHVQVGLLPGGPTPVPMDVVVARELEVLGSHGLAAADYPPLLGLVSAGRLRPDVLVGRRITLDEVETAMPALDTGSEAGITVVDRLGPAG